MTAAAAPGGAVGLALERLRSFGSKVVADGDIGSLTTYRVGGPAAILVTVARPDELEAVAAAVGDSGLDVLVLGRGSNLLVADAGFGGLAVTLDPDGFGHISIDGTALTAGAAVPLPALARRSVESGLTGLEWAVGVPGSVGGGIRMNAGGHGSDMASVVRSALIHDLRRGEVALVEGSHLDYRYRHSAVLAHQVVTQASFELAPGDPEEGRRTIRQIVRWRREHQPGGQNAGSVFTNPPGDSAGRLIEAAGLKGRRLRTAMVSTKHANFIQADPGGSADDVRALMGLIQAEVGERLGVELQPEVRLVGFPVEPSSRGLESREESS